MFGFGAMELLLIFGIILIIFGAGKLPQIVASLGNGIKEFRSATENTAEPVKKESAEV